MSHFIYSYTGNKRNEMKHILPILNFDNIDTIFEPFCGSAAMSFNVYKNIKKDLKFILNDNDPELIEVYHILKTETIEFIENKINELMSSVLNKEDYKNIHEEYKITKDLYKLIYLTRYSKMGRKGFFDTRITSCRGTNKGTPFKFTKLQTEFIEFIKNPNVSIVSNDWFVEFENVKNNPNVMILMDPPYLSSCNSFYKSQTSNVYEYFAINNMHNFESKIYFILENNWIVKLLFKDLDFIEYNKSYNISKKNTSHAIYSNKDIVVKSLQV